MEGFFGFCAEVELSTVGADPGTGAGDGALIAGVAQDAEEALIEVGTISRAGLAAALGDVDVGAEFGLCGDVFQWLVEFEEVVEIGHDLDRGPVDAFGEFDALEIAWKEGVEVGEGF